MRNIRVLVCGKRDYNDYTAVCGTLGILHAMYGIGAVIHGGAKGADALAKQWAIEHGVPEVCFVALWQSHGRAAGPIRNRQMLTEGKPDLVVAFPGGPGTQNMARQAKAHGVPVSQVPSAKPAYRTE